MKSLADNMNPKGRVEIFTCRGTPTLKLGRVIPYDNIPEHIAKFLPVRHASHELDFSNTEIIDQQDVMNIIVNTGKDKVIESVSSGFINPIVRMAVGDRGAIPSDATVPKIPVTTMSALYNEVHRADIDATILDVGTPTKHEVKFIKTFSSILIPITSFSNQALPQVNEVGLITADLLAGTPLPRAGVSFPSPPLADERLFSIRTFKSVPFEAANEISVTIRYTIFVE